MLDKKSYDTINEFHEINPEMYDLFMGEYKSMLDTTSMACHEIKNQVALISSYCQLLESQNDELCDNLFFQKASTNVSNLLNLMDQLSIYRYSFLTNNLNSLNIMDIFDIAVKKCLEENIKISHKNKISSRMKPVVYGNQERLVRCFLSIIQNAHEACPKKPVKIITQLDKDNFIAHIIDNGDGFTPGYIEEYKKPFVSSKKHHCGLGLSIAYNTCIMHKGDLQISSSSRGSQITISLPLFT